MDKLTYYAPEKLVYIDELAIDEFISREYGLGLRGHKITGEISGGRYARDSIIAGQLQNK